MKSIEGFRGLGVILVTWGVLLGDTFFSQVTGASADELKTAFIASIPITLKLIWTDAKPRISAMLK